MSTTSLYAAQILQDSIKAVNGSTVAELGAACRRPDAQPITEHLDLCRK